MEAPQRMTSSGSWSGFRLKTRQEQMTAMVVFLLLLAIATFVSYRQSAPPQFEKPHAVGSWRCWLKPWEQNTALRPAVTSTRLISITFVSPQSGWAVSYGGTILHTADGGTSWQPQTSGTPYILTSVAFVSPQSGWAVGERGTILHTDDAGKSWKPQTSGTRQWLVSVAFVSPQSGWAVGQVGTILHTADGGTSWQPQTSGTPYYLRSVAFVSPQSGWAVGTYGTILHTADGGTSWQPQTSGTQQILYSVAFVSPQSGWAVGAGGTILHTADGGTSWQPQTSGTQAVDLSSVAFVSPQSGWAVGQGDTILHTEDGGLTWQRQGYRRWPAPWFALALIFCIAGFIWALQPLAPEATPYIEDLANADSPVAQLKYDALGYRPLVRRLLRFIQNPKTKPPLVLAVQAPWGMGKSSVMAMLQTELKSNRAAVTVWFNAWHHQKEDQLLAYLLEAIQ